MLSCVGPNLAPSYWNPERNWRHVPFLELIQLIRSEHGIYSLSVWRSAAAAHRHLALLSKEPKVLLRIPRCTLADAGLTVIEDDALPSEAFLCYEIIPHDTQAIYGRSQIPWSEVVQCDTGWGPVQVEEEDLHAVAHPWATRYKWINFDHDWGLPYEEQALRAHLRHLVFLEGALRQTPWWNLTQRLARQAALASVHDLLRSALLHKSDDGGFTLRIHAVRRAA